MTIDELKSFLEYAHPDHHIDHEPLESPEAEWLLELLNAPFPCGFGESESRPGHVLTPWGALTSDEARGIVGDLIRSIIVVEGG